jgi:hypothetical protein
MNAKNTKRTNASLRKAEIAMLRRKVVPFRKLIDYHLRRLIANPGETTIIVNVVDRTGNALAAQVFKGPGPSPPGMQVRTFGILPMIP